MTVQGKTERRSHKRYYFREEVLLEGTYAGTSADISQRGIFVFSLEPYGEDIVIDSRTQRAIDHKIRLLAGGAGFRSSEA